jgi:hypothetical protein
MKKVVFLLVATFSINFLFAQATKVNVLETKIENIDCIYSKRIDANRGDTIYSVAISFQNLENEKLKDIQSIDLLKK